MSVTVSEYILCAALHVQDGKNHSHQPKNIETGYVVCGRRHHNCYYLLGTLTGDRTVNRTPAHLQVDVKGGQGFLTNMDRYVDRQEAHTIALAAGQISSPNSPALLFSEDLY